LETKKNSLDHTEQLKSFDVLSSLNLYRYDLQTFGHILPETRQRVYDEEWSYIAEGINRPNYKEFSLHSINGQLVYFHEGSWQPYIDTLITGLETAKAEAAGDFRKSFEVERRVDDLQRGYQIQNLKAGEKIVWRYDFPHQQQELHGPKFLESMGFQPTRKLGYLCEAEKTAEEETVIRHQSVDNSDEEAFEAAILVGEGGGSVVDMRVAYDAALKNKFGVNFFAGRAVDSVSPEENAWSVIECNRDLIEDYFMQQLEFLAHQDNTLNELERAKKRLTYGVWAAIKERLDNNAPNNDGSKDSLGSIHAEVQSAYSALSARGEVLFGCGGSISGEESLLNASPKNVFESIYGQKMSCPFCGATQYGDPCSSNQFCSDCKAEVANGRIKSKGNGGKKVQKLEGPGFFEIISLELARYEQERKVKEAAKKAA
jgi:hypothetical protein